MPAPFSNPKLVSDLLTDVKLAMFWDADGEGNAPFTDAEIVRVAQQCLEDKLYPAIGKARESYLIAIVDTPLSSPASYDNTPSYSVPSEGMARLASVSYLKDGKEYPLEEYEESEWVRRVRNYSGTQVDGFAFRGGRIHLLNHPTDVSNRYLRVRYAAKPMTMTSDSAVLYRRLTADPTVVGGSRVRFTLDSTVASTTWMTGANQQIAVDLSVLSAAAPHVPLEILDTNGVSETFALAAGLILDVPIATVWPYASGNPTTARKGDFLIADFQSPIIQLPHEAYRLLRQAVVMEFADAVGDRDKYQRVQADFMRGLEELPNILRPRNEDPETYVNWTSPGRVRRWGGRWR